MRIQAKREVHAVGQKRVHLLDNTEGKIRAPMKVVPDLTATCKRAVNNPVYAYAASKSPILVVRCGHTR